MSERFREALTDAWRRIEEREWIFGWLGKVNADTSVTYEVPGRKNFLYVLIRNSNGAQTTVPARNDAGVPLEARLPVKLKLEKGVYVIYGRTARSDLGTITILPGVGARNFTELNDAPASYSGASGFAPLVNVTEDALEFVDLSSLYSDIAHTHTLNDLSDVVMAGLSDGDVLTYDIGSGTWSGETLPAPPTFALDDLTDVTLGLLSDGLVLTYDSGTGQWGGEAPVVGVTDHGALTGLGDDDHTQYILADGTRPLVGDWDAGGYEVRSATFESDVATGTAPLVIASTTKVVNLNVDLLDDQEGSYYLDAGNFTGTNWTDLTDSGATTLHKHDHGGMDGLADDDHSQYALLAGRAGGQVVKGGLNSGDDLTLESTNNATKGDVLIQPNGGYVGIGGTPSYDLHLLSAASADIAVQSNDDTSSSFGALRALTNGGDVHVFFASHDTLRTIARCGITLGGWAELLALGTGLAGLLISTNTADPLVLGTNDVERMRILSTGEIGIGTATPQGILHSYKSPSGALHWSNASVSNTTVTIIPDGTGDVVYKLTGFFVIEQGGNVASDILALAPGDTYDVAIGTGTWRFAVVGGGTPGAFTVIRNAGTGTARVAVQVLWM